MLRAVRVFRKGMSVTIESILIIGGILVSMLFFVSFYNLSTYQADNVFSSSEDGFVNNLKMKIYAVYISRSDTVEYSFKPPVKAYHLTVKDRKISLKYPSREIVDGIVVEDIKNANIENSDIICIRKSEGTIELIGGRCPNVCNPIDDECDAGCKAFGICDRKCNDCEEDGD